MDRAARRFTRRVLILHVVLFAILLVIIALSVRVLYQAAREQAIDQARQTQELLAKQTALGLQNYYASITGVLELLQPDEAPASGAQTPLPAVSEMLARGPFSRLAGSIWKSLEERISLLFVLDPREPMNPITVIGAQPNAPSPQELLEQASSWLASVERASISGFIRTETGGAHLVCVPLRAPRRLLMVAVVPIARIEQNLLRSVNERPTTGAMLVDDAGTIISNPRIGAVGLNVQTDIQDPRTRQLAQHYMALGAAGTEVFERRQTIGQTVLDPAMSTIQPADILGKRWYVVISSSLSDIDKIVKPIFRDAMLWSGFIMLALTALLTSTAIQMIRSRIRLERFRHEIVNKELSQAREIQLAWLPKNHEDPPGVDLSAINEPATQISGDFYNWFQLCDGRTAAVIGDVTGHGMAAAFLMATTQLLVRTTMPRFQSPGECLQEVNRQLCQNAFNGQFVTMLLLVIDARSGVIEAATAGHPPPLVGQGGHFEPLALEPQLVLGVDPDAKYVTQRFTLARRSAMLLYTDGVVDALNQLGERFGIERLRNSLYARYEHAHAMIDAVLTSINSFRGVRDLPDDLTLLAIQLQPATAAKTPLDMPQVATKV